MDPSDRARDPVKTADDLAIRQAMWSLVLMLGFVGVGFGLAGYGAYCVWSKPDTPVTGPRPTDPAHPGGDARPKAPDEDPTPPAKGPPPVEIGADLAQQIDQYIEQLGAPEYKIRNNASTGLRELGERARAALERARQSSDAEVRDRALRLIQELDAKRR